MTETTIIRRDPPPRRAVRTDLSDLDDRIVRAVREQAKRTVEVAEELNEDTHTVATRLRLLTGSGRVERLRDALVRNGPGASTYRALPA